MEDPIFEAWVERVPTITTVGQTPPWRLYVLQEGKWKRAEVNKYKKGLKLLRKLDDADDLALACKKQAFKPPVLRDKKTGEKFYWRKFPADHHWCGYCRRPTVFTTFQRHHALRKDMCTPYEPRCTVCGVRLVFLGSSALRGLIS